MRFRRLLVIFPIICFVRSLGFSQAPPPPPPPLVYAAPAQTEIKEFVDRANKFKISFPGSPRKIARTGSDRTETTYSVYRKGSNSTVTVVLLEKNVGSKSSEFLEEYKNRLSYLASGQPRRGLSNATLLFDREVKAGGAKGREMGFESDFYYTQAAVFIVGNRIYEIKTDVTNWHMLKRFYPEVVKGLTAEADRFRKSFSFVK